MAICGLKWGWILADFRWPTLLIILWNRKTSLAEWRGSVYAFQYAASRHWHFHWSLIWEGCCVLGRSSSVWMCVLFRTFEGHFIWRAAGLFILWATFLSDIFIQIICAFHIQVQIILLRPLPALISGNNAWKNSWRTIFTNDRNDEKGNDQQHYAINLLYVHLLAS